MIPQELATLKKIAEEAADVWPEFIDEDKDVQTYLNKVTPSTVLKMIAMIEKYREALENITSEVSESINGFVRGFGETQQLRDANKKARETLKAIKGD